MRIRPDGHQVILSRYAHNLAGAARPACGHELLSIFVLFNPTMIRGQVSKLASSLRTFSPDSPAQRVPGSVFRTLVGHRKIRKTKACRFVFSFCGPTRIRTPVNGFGNRHSTTEL